MRLLVLGGTAFLSASIVREALDRGHRVVCAARGLGAAPPPGAALVRWDRGGPAPTALRASGPFDAVVDVARAPSHVRRALDVVGDVPWVFVSTVSVYADDADAGGPGVGELRAAVDDETEPGAGPEAYGGLKVACEAAVRARTPSSTVLRAGLIVGPGDPSGRFAYWAARRDRVGDVLAPGAPDDPVQLVDVRDLAAWAVDLAEAPLAGVHRVLDAVASPIGIGELVATCVPRGRPVWVDHERLTAAGVAPWAGPGSIGLWLPRPAFDGMLAHDAGPALAAGLRPRPLAETCADTAAWLAATPDAVVGGIDEPREAALLATFGTP